MGSGDRALHRRSRLKALLAGAVLLLIAALALALVDGPDRVDLDVVAVAEQRLGVELESSWVETNGIRLHVVQAGPPAGPPVVLLHGFPEFWWAWLHQIDDLAAAGFRVIVPDQRGYNRSDKPRAVEAYALSELVRDVAGLAESLGHARVSLAGHDWGGRVAWDLALRRPELVRKLAIVNMGHPLAFAELEHTPGRQETVGWYRSFFQIPWLPEQLLSLADWALPARFLRRALPDGVISADEIEYYKRAWDGAMGTMIHWYRAQRRYPPPLPEDTQVRVPTLIVWGMQDRFLDAQLARLSAKRCDSAQLVELAEVGHFVLQEAGDEAAALLVEFFASNLVDGDDNRRTDLFPVELH